MSETATVAQILLLGVLLCELLLLLGLFLLFFLLLLKAKTAWLRDSLVGCNKVRERAWALQKALGSSTRCFPVKTPKIRPKK